jgi:hypothetical protein
VSGALPAKFTELAKRVADLVTIVRGPRRTPIAQVVSAIRAREIVEERNRWVTQNSARLDAFRLLETIAEAADLTILDLLDTLGIK